MALSVSKIIWVTITDSLQKSLAHLGKETRSSKMSAHTAREFLNWNYVRPNQSASLWHINFKAHVQEISGAIW